MSEDFSKNLIADYKHWDVYIHDNQGYLGRCVIWCKREDAKNLEDATVEEMAELLEIVRKLKKAVGDCFGSDWFNYSFLANIVVHLHCHFVPRYKSAREFDGVTFSDSTWGNNYWTDHSFTIPRETVDKIKEQIKDKLKESNG